MGTVYRTLDNDVLHAVYGFETGMSVYTGKQRCEAYHVTAFYRMALKSSVRLPHECHISVRMTLTLRCSYRRPVLLLKLHVALHVSSNPGSSHQDRLAEFTALNNA